MAAGAANATGWPGEIHARLRFGRVEDIMAGGLHDFLTAMINRTCDARRADPGVLIWRA